MTMRPTLIAKQMRLKHVAIAAVFVLAIMVVAELRTLGFWQAPGIVSFTWPQWLQQYHWAMFSGMSASLSSSGKKLPLCPRVARAADPSKGGCAAGMSVWDSEPAGMAGAGVVITANLASRGHYLQVARLLEQLTRLESQLPVEVFYAGSAEAPSEPTRWNLASAARGHRAGPPQLLELFATLAQQLTRGSQGNDNEKAAVAACAPDLSALTSDRQPFTLYKPLAAAASHFRTVLLLDANLVLFQVPELLLQRPDFLSTGLLLFRDYWPGVADDQIAAAGVHFGLKGRGSQDAKSAYGVSWPDAIDSSAVVMDKARAGRGLCSQVNFVLGGAGSGDVNGGGVPYFLGDKDTWLFAAVAHNANRSTSVAVNPRKAGFFLRDFMTTTSYRPVWGHLQVDRDGLPLFWNEQPSAPRLGPTSGLYYYDGQRLPRPWKDPPVEWGAGPALYPHVPEGCGDQCQKIPLNAVQRLPEPALALLLKLKLVRDDDAYPEPRRAAARLASMHQRNAAAMRARQEAPLSPWAQSLASLLGNGRFAVALFGPAAQAPLGPKKAKAITLGITQPSPNLRPASPFKCQWRGNFVRHNDGIVPLFSLEEVLRTSADALPLPELLRSRKGDEDEKEEEISDDDEYYPHQESRSRSGTESQKKDEALFGVSPVVHQVWKSRCIPMEWASYVATWGNQPRVKRYVLWTDAAMDALVLGRFDCTSLAYVWRFLATAPGGTKVKTSEVVKRADLFRFLVVWLYGGIYADLDIGAKAADVTALQREAANTIIWEPFWAQDNYHIAPLAPSQQNVQTNTRHLRHDGRLVLIAFLAAQTRGSDFIAFVLARQLEWLLVRAAAEARSSDQWWGFRRAFAGNAVTETGPSTVARAYHSYVRQQPPHPAPLAHQQASSSSSSSSRGAKNSDRTHHDQSRSINSSSLSVPRARSEAEQGLAADPLPGKGGALYSGDDGAISRAWPRFKAVNAMDYNNFSANWAEHHGSCSWCAEKAVAKKYDGAQQCVDIEDLIPRHKLRMPLAGSQAHRPLPSHPAASGSSSSHSRDSHGRLSGAALADSILWIAALNGRLTAVEKLLAAPGTKVDATNNAGATALHVACERGHTAVVKALLGAGAKVEHQDGALRRPLVGAAAGGHREVVELLLQAGANKKSKSFERGLTAKYVARALGHTHVLDIL